MAKAEIRNLKSTILSDEWATLTRHEFELKRRDGVWEAQIRQSYDRGHAAVILPFDPARKTVLLVRQFRLPRNPAEQSHETIKACA